MKTLLLFAMLLTTALLTGCGVKAPLEGRADPYTPAQVHFANEDLRRLTAVGALKVSRDQAGLLYVTVPIRAATDYKLYVDYRFTYFDEHGVQINQTAWFTKTLEPNTPDQVSGNSMSPRAADFQCDFRYAQ